MIKAAGISTVESTHDEPCLETAPDLAGVARINGREMTDAEAGEYLGDVISQVV